MKQLLIPDLYEEMQQVDELLSAQLAPISPDPEVNRILKEVSRAEGKKIRPQLLLLCARYGERCVENRIRLCTLAALVEMVHMASLIHDDIVDDSPTRRGLPTIQASFGKDMAVYTGDLLLSRVMHVLFGEGLISEGMLFADTIENMCAGEIGQYSCYFDTETTADRYMKNIYGKTAAVFELTCRLGCMDSGCSAELTEIFAQIGRQTGLLFQIRDDLLDYTCTPEVDGKPSHMDFREGILTLPVLYGLENKAFRPEIESLVAKAKAAIYDRADERRLNRILEESGGMERARSAAGKLTKILCGLVDQLPDNKNERYLRGMIRKLSV